MNALPLKRKGFFLSLNESNTRCPVKSGKIHRVKSMGVLDLIQGRELEVKRGGKQEQPVWVDFPGSRKKR